jgi:hypothetical protein
MPRSESFQVGACPVVGCGRSLVFPAALCDRHLAAWRELSRSGRAYPGLAYLAFVSGQAPDEVLLRPARKRLAGTW